MTAFIAQQVTLSHTIHLPATPREVFPLFSPLGEKRWVQGWNPEMLYPSSGVAQVGTVFTTRDANQQKIGSTSDSTLSSGEINFGAIGADPTDVAFRNVEVWTP